MLYMAVNRRNECAEIHEGMSAFQRKLKRAIDITSAATGLLLLSPLYLVVYIVLKLQGDGPVFYTQERIGLGGRPFNIYKFRTMRPDAESEGPKLAQANDERLTKVGKFLRNHHLDELPQLWNVLIGDMSLVGPRPERQYFIDKIMKEDARYRFLFRVRPGVTSEATLYNGYTGTMEKMLERLSMDLQYLENGTIAKDFVIIFKTIGHIFVEKKNNN